MRSLDPDAMQDTFVLEGARIAVLGYDAEARAHAHALREAGNSVTIGLDPETTAWWRASSDGFVVEQPGSAVAAAEIIVVRTHDTDVLWRQSEPRVAAGALVVMACARQLQSGACARSGMDVVLVTSVDDERVGCRIAVHRDVTRRALVRAVAYAQAAFGAGVAMRSASVTEEAELELATDRERAHKMLALTVSSERLPARPLAPPPHEKPAPHAKTWNADDEEQPALVDDASWFYSMLNRRGTK